MKFSKSLAGHAPKARATDSLGLFLLPMNSRPLSILIPWNQQQQQQQQRPASIQSSSSNHINSPSWSNLSLDLLSNSSDVEDKKKKKQKQKVVQGKSNRHLHKKATCNNINVKSSMTFLKYYYYL